MSSITSGNNNLCFGIYAGDNITSGSSNTIIGPRSDTMRYDTIHATAVGDRTAASTGSLSMGYGAIAEGKYSVAFGHEANTKKDQQMKLGSSSISTAILSVVPGCDKTTSLGTQKEKWAQVYADIYANFTSTQVNENQTDTIPDGLIMISSKKTQLNTMTDICLNAKLAEKYRDTRVVGINYNVVSYKCVEKVDRDKHEKKIDDYDEETEKIMNSARDDVMILCKKIKNIIDYDKSYESSEEYKIILGVFPDLNKIYKERMDNRPTVSDNYKATKKINSHVQHIITSGQSGIWVCSEIINDKPKQHIECGDYLCHYFGGYACNQGDGIMRNYTVAKALKNEHFSDKNVVQFKYKGRIYRRAKIPCVVLCG